MVNKENSEQNSSSTINMDVTNRYQNLINFLTDYIYTVKIKDGIAIETIHGPGCVSVTGYTSDDYKEDPALWFRMVHTKDQEKVLEQARLALLGEEVKKDDITNK